MGMGNLKIALYLADEAIPVKNLTVLVRDPVTGKILHELIADENGITPLIALTAPDRESSIVPYSNMPRSGRYDVEIPAQSGYKHVIIHGVEIFDGETSILPVQMHPAVAGDTPEENTDEIFIPEKHGVDDAEGRGHPSSNRGNMRSGAAIPVSEDIGDTTLEKIAFASPTTDILANDIAIPTHITVHLGSPNSNRV